MIRSLLLATGIASVLSCGAQAQVVTTGQTQTVATGPSGTTTTTVTTTASGPAAVQAQAAAQSAQITAQTAAVPPSGYTGAVTLSGNNSGIEEADILTAVAVKAAASRIGFDIEPKDKTGEQLSGLLVTAGPSAPDISAWLAFQQHAASLAATMTQDTQAVNVALSAIQTSTKPPTTPAGKSKDRIAVLAAAAAIGVIRDIASYFATNYQVAGLALTPDDYMLQVALLSKHPTWQLLSQVTVDDLPQDVSQPLGALFTQANSAASLIATASAVQAVSSQSTNSTVKALADPLKTAITNLTGDVANYNSLLNGLAGVTGGNSPTLSQILQARLIANAIKGSGILYVKVHSAAGGIITKTNILTYFGAMPFYASAGVVVSYAYYKADTDGSVKIAKADLISVLTPYNKIYTVPQTVQFSNSGACDSQNQSDDAKKLCAIAP